MFGARISSEGTIHRRNKKEEADERKKGRNEGRKEEGSIKLQERANREMVKRGRREGTKERRHEAIT
ncbi:hypothetical protein E2C01_045521 [Portunus trituberculatus]|uniref:Uncharacterized protein n=1 Tax=Portunus trituberculatus TaxID=210409 RepID=A0A5B7G2A7_PORTR|nr:hypothetical protein [Portunus trituberculatus]